MSRIFCSQRLCQDNAEGECTRIAIAWSEIAYQICIKKGPLTLDHLPKAKKEEE